MRGYDFAGNKELEADLSALSENSSFTLVCNTKNLPQLQECGLAWDKAAVRISTNLDDNMYYASYRGYDFLSLFFLNINCDNTCQAKLSIFFSQKYLIVVLPEQPDSTIKMLTEDIFVAFETAKDKAHPLTYLYHYILEWMVTNSSNILEALEDEMEDISEAMEVMVDKKQNTGISELRKKAYTYKKLLRAFSDISEQILIDENNLLDKESLRYFRIINTRLHKLHELADSLFAFSQELLHDYESKLSFQMNENVKKLTLLTIFFGPPTIISGIYGMNFANMPEHNWLYGYPFALGIMLLVSIVIYIILRINKWF